MAKGNKDPHIAEIRAIRFISIPEGQTLEDVMKSNSHSLASSARKGDYIEDVRAIVGGIISSPSDEFIDVKINFGAPYNETSAKGFTLVSGTRRYSKDSADKMIEGLEELKRAGDTVYISGMFSKGNDEVKNLTLVHVKDNNVQSF